MTIRNSIKAGAWTALWAFAALFGASILGFLTQVGEWASANGRAPFPDVSVLGYAFISATVAALSGIVGTIVRLAQSAGLIPGQPPAYAQSADATYTGDEVQGFIDQAHRDGRAKRRKPLIDELGQVSTGVLLVVVLLVVLLILVTTGRV